MIYLKRNKELEKLRGGRREEGMSPKVTTYKCQETKEVMSSGE